MLEVVSTLGNFPSESVSGCRGVGATLEVIASFSFVPEEEGVLFDRFLTTFFSFSSSLSLNSNTLSSLELNRSKVAG